MGCGGDLGFFLPGTSFVSIPSVCGVGHLEVGVGTVGRFQTMGFEG